jgi:hypothetical protein
MSIDAKAQEDGRCERYPIFGMRWQTVFAFIERAKAPVMLSDRGRLEVDAPPALGWRRIARSLSGGIHRDIACGRLPGNGHGADEKAEADE